MTAGRRPDECEECGCVCRPGHCLCDDCERDQPCHHCGGTGLVPNPDPLFFGMGPENENLICPECKGEDGFVY